MGNLCCEEDDPGRKIPRIAKKQSNHEPDPKLEQEQESEPNLFPEQQIPIAKHSSQNYQYLKYLGRGTFGDVVLAQDKTDNKQYAMKIIEKRKIKQFNVLQCKLIRQISKLELFCRIKQTFQNESKIYIVMEYLQRGDIYYYLRRKEYVFKQDIIKNLVAEIIVGIEILHSNGIIYRELKPENLLVTDEGHIKLTDYGLSKMMMEEKSLLETFVGTLEYTAPEVLRGNYGKEVDLWAIGVLMYELRFENNPFESNQIQSVSSIQLNIEKSNIEDRLNEIIGLISLEFRDVLIRLLQKDPDKRISIEELKRHGFFDGIVWEEVRARSNPPPLQQFLTSNCIKFRDPMEGPQLPHRKLLDNKHQDFKANLYQFRSSQ